MAFDLTNLIPIYQNSIDNIIDQLSKVVTIYYKPTYSPEPSDDLYDEIRQEWIKRPKYQSANPPTVTENTETINALIKYNTKDFSNFGIVVNDSKGIIRLKTYLTDIPKLLRAEYIIPSQSKDIIFAKYRLLRAPIPVGLRDNRYAISFWEQI